MRRVHLHRPRRGRPELPQHPSIISALHHGQRGHPPRLRPAVGERGLRGRSAGRAASRSSARAGSMPSWATRPGALHGQAGGRSRGPGQRGPLEGVDEAQVLADTIGYPVRGQRPRAAVAGHAHRPRARQLAQAFATASGGGAAFGSSELYLEKFVRSSHVEVQVAGPTERHPRAPGRARLLGAAPPSEAARGESRSAISEETRAGLYKAALAVANSVNYVSAGTVEFLVTRAARSTSFEMNPHPGRHPITRWSPASTSSRADRVASASRSGTSRARRTPRATRSSAAQRETRALRPLARDGDRMASTRRVRRAGRQPLMRGPSCRPTTTH